MYKMVNGLTVKCDYEEEAVIRKTWEQNETEFAEEEKKSLKTAAAKEKLYAAAGLTEEERELLR